MCPIYTTDVPLLPTVLFLYILVNKYMYIFFLEFLSPSSFIPPQNVLYILMLHFLVHKIFTYYTHGVLNCKCPAPGPKGYTSPAATIEVFVDVFQVGRDSSVGIATGYGLYGPGIESWWRARFSAPVQTGPGAYPATNTMGTGSFPG
jgi:hypothetical protein